MSSKEEVVVAQLFPPQEGQTLDPSFVRFVTEYFYLDNLLINLVELSPDGTYRNALAENIDLSQDKKALTIKIKKAYFSDGKRITSQDVVQTFKRTILLGTAHSEPKNYIKGAKSLKTMNDNIEGLRIVSDSSFVLELNSPMKELYYFLHLTDFGILHPKQYEKEKLTVDDWSNYNSGPYLLIKEGDTYYFKGHNKSLNSHEDMPMRVEMNFYKDDKIVDALEKNKVDFGQITFKNYAAHIDELSKLNHINYYGDKSDGIIFLSLNPKSKKFENQKVRQWCESSAHLGQPCLFMS